LVGNNLTKTDMERALMRKKVVLGVDIGTSSSKGVLVTFEGSILR